MIRQPRRLTGNNDTDRASRAAGICEVDADAIRYAARLYATNAPAMSVHGLGLTEHVQGTEASWR